MKFRNIGLLAAVFALVVLPAVAIAPASPTCSVVVKDGDGVYDSVNVSASMVYVVSGRYRAAGRVTAVTPDGRTAFADHCSWYRWTPAPLVYVPENPGVVTAVHINDSAHVGFSVLGSSGLLAHADIQASAAPGG